MILFQVLWDRATASAVELCFNFPGNPVVSLDYQVAPAFEMKTPEGKAYLFGVREEWSQFIGNCLQVITLLQRGSGR